MSRNYSDEELNRYFNDPEARREAGGGPRKPGRRPERKKAPVDGFRGYFHRRFDDPRKAQAAMVLSVIMAGMLAVTMFLSVYAAFLTSELPSTRELENPKFQLASIAYTADGRELARYARQNRSWVTLDEISPHVINALVATEDHRFSDHWGIDLFRTFSSIAHTLMGDRQGGSTITQQLARNLYNEQIGKEVTAGRKLKEMITAIQLERRYTKPEIIEMYLNTVEYIYNAFGIEAAARTYFNTSSSELDPLQAAALIGMLQNPSRFNPVRFHDRTQARRNTVLRQMVKHDFLTEAYFQEHREKPIEIDLQRSEITATFAPYFAEFVRNWTRDWARDNGYDLFGDGLVIYTTIDSRMQELANAAAQEQMDKLQAVVDFEWSRRANWNLGNQTDPYVAQTGHEPWAHFWATNRDLATRFVREEARFQSLRSEGMSEQAALNTLVSDEAFMDSLRTVKTRLEAGMVALDPRTGYVKAWVGGRDLSRNWNDHVAGTRRQPGSTFKPFVYVAAIDNGYSPYYMLMDSTFTYHVPGTRQVWTPTNAGNTYTGAMMTLKEGLSLSVNTVTARLVAEVGASQTAFYARRMGIRQSPLEEVPALALGTSDVTLLEMTAAYATMANGGIYNPPQWVTRIEDRNGNVLYEAEAHPEEALSERTAYTLVDMLRSAIDGGTGARIRWQWGLTDHDVAGKTGTTQRSADGWFMMMHPEIVMGAWVGFDDARVTFRPGSGWGQGARNALLLVGDFARRMDRSDDVQFSRTAAFPTPTHYDYPQTLPIHGNSEDQEESERDERQSERGRVGW
jgi:penicillin-binding protein 1A